MWGLKININNVVYRKMGILESGLLGAVVLIAFIFIGWIISGFAIKAAASMVNGKHISLERGMIISFASIIVFAVFFVIFGIFLLPLGFIIGLLGVIYVIKTMLRTGWLNGIVIAFIAWIVYIIVFFVISFIIGGVASISLQHLSLMV